MQSIAIILVEPQMGENIGAAARAMKNFALVELRIVNPRDGWPNEKADNMSVGAIDIISNAKIFDSIPSAIADLEYVYATTGTSREMNKEYVVSRNLIADLPACNKIGIMFGRENWGLNNQEISYANKIITIDTDLNFSSLNIAHAVAVVSYELFKQKQPSFAVVPKIPAKHIMAKNIEIEHFYSHLFTKLEEKQFFRVSEKKDHVKQKIRNLFGRINNLSQNELQILRGIVNVLSRK